MCVHVQLYAYLCVASYVHSSVSCLVVFFIIFKNFIHIYNEIATISLSYSLNSSPNTAPSQLSTFLLFWISP